MPSGHLSVSVIEARDVDGDGSEARYYVKLRINAAEAKTAVAEGTALRFVQESRLAVANADKDVLQVVLCQVGPHGDLVVGSGELPLAAFKHSGAAMHWLELSSFRSPAITACLCLVLQYCSHATVIHTRSRSPSPLATSNSSPPRHQQQQQVADKHQELQVSQAAATAAALQATPTIPRQQLDPPSPTQQPASARSPPQVTSRHSPTRNTQLQAPTVNQAAPPARPPIGAAASSRAAGASAGSDGDAGKDPTWHTTIISPAAGALSATATASAAAAAAVAHRVSSQGRSAPDRLLRTLVSGVLVCARVMAAARVLAYLQGHHRPAFYKVRRSDIVYSVGVCLSQEQRAAALHTQMHAGQGVVYPGDRLRL